jgi:hypothetical protein
MSADWYDSEATVRYTPRLGASGTIGLQYAFGGPGTLAGVAFMFLLSSAVALLAGRFILTFRDARSSRGQREARVAELRRRVAERGVRRDDLDPPRRE